MTSQLAPRQESLPTIEPQSESVALMHIIERCISDPNMDIARLEKMLDLKQKWDEKEARKAFLTARSKFAANAPKVLKDKTNPQYGSKYSTLENTLWTLTPTLSEYGLSVSWRPDEKDGMIYVTCTLSHDQGHSESITLPGPPDDSGKKNRLQQVKSTLTYLKLQTLEMITGTASVEGNLSDDGNGSGDAPELVDDTTLKMLDGMAKTDDRQKFLAKHRDHMTQAEADRVLKMWTLADEQG